MLQKGFTLIELMIVVAIIGILSMFALPAYQDYTKRTYVAEGIGLASAAKMAATEYYSSEAKWPTTNSKAGLPKASEIRGQSVEKISLGGTASKPTITITYGSKVVAAKSATLVLTPDASKIGSVTWKCSEFGGGMEKKWLPANCRDAAVATTTP
ncbi:pilin [Wohlfahrtiimonas chitiniclastica]|uniref:pilin n=1 Tax=Wohlfahrtiimonas chitiniclastica TaxID=400946 RepID=UPI001BCAC812|nr:pilin [Wohlfahrtiimonas chitiniclastica]MBS7834939.1 pilin [Wohlfahrtiimonas chitiniclastica]MBS7836898.1 pilin [Wohlfahrtiimonas chitiniclastica]